MAERADRPDTGAVLFMDARVDDMLEKIKVLPHRLLMYRDSSPDQPNFTPCVNFARSGSFNLRAQGLYQGCRATDYDVTGPYGISVADPGAVPGASTNFPPLAGFILLCLFSGVLGAKQDRRAW